MQFAMEELIEAFENKSGIKAEMILSSSGKLTAQIQAGAPYDLFFSADSKYPEKLASSQLTNAPVVYAYGQLVEWQKPQGKKELYAMANPKTAPYGKATEDYLEATGRALPDVVYGESISQVNQFLLSGTVDAGFTSYSSVKSKKFSSAGEWILIPDSLHQPIAQAYVVVSKSKKKSEAEAFAQFISSVEAKDILRAYGYRVNWLYCIILTQHLE